MKFNRALIATSLLMACSATFAQPSLKTDAEKQAYKEWQNRMQEAMSHYSPGETHCYDAKYPDPQPTEVPCLPKSNRPQTLPPHVQGLINDLNRRNRENASPSASAPSGAESDATRLVGGGQTDWMAQIYNFNGYLGNYNSVTGSFTELTHAPKAGYTIQLNSNVWQYSQLCGGTFADPKCIAWQQFVYDSFYKQILAQSWLIGYRSLNSGHCPGGWAFSDDNCYLSSVAAGPYPIADKNLINVQLHAALSTGDGGLLFFFIDGKKNLHGISTADPLGLGIPIKAGGHSPGSGWIQAEFNIFGVGGGATATFPKDTTIGINIDANPYNGATASKCITHSVTGEKSDMTIGACTARADGIAFTETNVVN